MYMYTRDISPGFDQLDLITIPFVGNGRYQYTLLLVCGIMFCCIGSQYGINAYILPSAECDFDMRSEEKGFLNVAFFVGEFP